MVRRRNLPGVLLLFVLATGAGCVTVAPRSRPVSEAAIVFEQVPVRHFGPESCGAGSLSAVLTHLGESFTVEEMDAKLPRAPGGGVLSVDLLLAARELGYETVPCAVVELDDRRAKILSVNLNEMKGQSVSWLLSELVHDLSQELTLGDLESQLPYSEAELKDVLEIMKIPDGLEAYLDEEVEKAERERPHILSFVVEDVETVEKAIEEASRRNGGLTRGKALVEITRAYVSEVTPS